MLNLHRKTENAHIFLWLIKDACWISDWKIPGLIMIVPTISVAIYLTWKLRYDISELAHNLAICCWISANSIWMIGEFYFKDTTRPIALIFFIIGLMILLIYYLSRIFSARSKKIPEQM